MSDAPTSGGWTDAQIREMVRGLLDVATPEEVVSVIHGLRQEEAQVATERTPFQERYWTDPVGFCRNCISWRKGEGLTAYQEEILDQLPVKLRVCQRGPHGLGKTSVAAWAILWFALTRDGFDWKCVTTASNNRQLKQFLWPEIHKWARRVRWDRVGRKPLNTKTELITTELKLRTGGAFAATASDPAGIEGAHAQYLLYVFDESKAIPDAIFDAAEGAFSSGEQSEAYALASSTPGEPQGRFWEIQTNDKGRFGDWWARAVTMEEVIAAGRMTAEWAKQRAVQWGPESFIYKNRVRGDFAAQGKDSVIPAAWVELAQERWHERAILKGRAALLTPVVIAVDVAGEEGVDKTVIGIRAGKRMAEVHDFLHINTMDTVQRVEELARLWKPERIVIDTIGLGAGVYDRLKQLEYPVIAFVASHRDESLDLSEQIGFHNRRAAAWWALREALHPELGKDLELHPHEQLLPDLTAPTYKTPGRNIVVESKDDIRRRLKRSREDGGSTDVGDTVVMAFWDGASGAYEEAYGVHTAGSLRAAEVKSEEELTEEEQAERYARWEAERLWGSEDTIVEIVTNQWEREFGGYR